MKRQDLLAAPVCEALLLLWVGLIGWAVHKPLLFASLGPTAYELIETPRRKSAKPKNVIGGHLIAIGAAYAALWITRAWWVPPVSSAGVPGLRIAAAVVAALLTVFGTLATEMTQPAALSTTLLVSLGVMQKPIDALYIGGSVVMTLILGEPLRIWRARQHEEAEQREKQREQQVAQSGVDSDLGQLR